MKRRSDAQVGTWLPIGSVLFLAAVLHFWHLGQAPMFFGGDESFFAIHAHALTTTGRDLNGRFLPLFVQVHPGIWFSPMLFYLVALFLKVLPMSEWVVRAPIATIAVLDILLLYLVARRLFSSRWHAVLAALILTLTPAHVIFGRQAVDYICPLPFVLLWLWCLLVALEKDSLRLPIALGLVLGIGVYSYIAAWTVMPVCLAITWVAFGIKRKPLMWSLAATAAFITPLLLLVAWLYAHPDMMPAIAGRYHLADSQHMSLLQSARELLHYYTIQERLQGYWNEFNPVYLYLSGSSNITHATRKAGVFLVPIAVFLLCGIYDLCRRSSTGAILLAGLLTAPVGTTLIGTPQAIQRELVIVLFVALIATFGVAFLWRDPRRSVRVFTLLLLVYMPLQFVYFYRDYLTGYRVRAAYWFDSTNMRGVADYIVARDTAGSLPEIELSEALDDGVPRWRFYLLKYGRPELWQRTRVVDPATLDASRVPIGSLLILYATDPSLIALTSRGGGWTVATTVVDAGGSPASIVLQRIAM